MSGLTALLLIFPGTPLDDLLKANPDAQFGFRHLGGWSVLLMFAACAACLCAAIGLWRYRRWGFLLAITMLGVNVAGDIVSASLRHDWRTLVGIPIGGAILFYLVRELRSHGQDSVSDPAA